MKTPSKIFTWSFHLKSTFSDFLKMCFLKIFFLHDEIIFFVRIFFCDQVCICTNPRNHLEHLPCPHDDSEPPTRTQCLGEISQTPQIRFHNYVHPQELSIVFVNIWGCLSSNRPISALKWSRMGKRLLWDTNKCPYSRSSWFREQYEEASRHDF